MNSQHSVLVVDDEPHILTALEFLLKKEGYQVHTATNGEEALKVYAELRPSLIVLDVMMPQLNGFQTAQRLHELYPDATFRILFLTAKGTPEDRMTGYSFGAERYMVKPFENDELLASLKEIASDIS